LGVLEEKCNSDPKDKLVLIKKKKFPSDTRFTHFSSYLEPSNPMAINQLIGGSGPISRDRLKMWWVGLVEWKKVNLSKLTKLIADLKTLAEKKTGSDFENCKKVLEFLQLMKKTFDGLDTSLNEFDALMSILPKDLDLDKIDPVFISLNGFYKLKSHELNISTVLTRYGNSKGVSVEEKKVSDNNNSPTITFAWQGDKNCPTDMYWNCYPIGGGPENEEVMACVNWQHGNRDFEGCLTHNTDDTCPRGGNAEEHISFSALELDKRGVKKLKLDFLLYRWSETLKIPMEVNFPPDRDGKKRKETFEWKVNNSLLKTPIWTLTLEIKDYISDVEKTTLSDCPIKLHLLTRFDTDAYNPPRPETEEKSLKGCTPHILCEVSDYEKFRLKSRYLSIPLARGPKYGSDLMTRVASDWNTPVIGEINGKIVFSPDYIPDQVLRMLISSTIFMFAPSDFVVGATKEIAMYRNKPIHVDLAYTPLIDVFGKDVSGIMMGYLFKNLLKAFIITT
jgi:hypothetical protein